MKRLCRKAPRQHSMDNPEKNRKAVVDRWCSFQEALGGTKRKYPTQEIPFVRRGRPLLRQLPVRKEETSLALKRGEAALRNYHSPSWMLFEI